MIAELPAWSFAEYAFMRRAAAGCIAVSLGSAPLGVFLLLRRLSLAADAVAHALLPGIAVAYLIAGLSVAAMLAGGIASGLAVALAAGLISRSTALREDANLAALYLGSLAVGVTLVSLRGDSFDLHSILFGAVLAIDADSLMLLALIATATLAALAAIYRPLVLHCADPSYLKQVSGSSLPVHLSFIALVVVNLACASQALGTLMAIGLMILPAAAARLWTSAVGGMIVLAVCIACACSLLGLALSLRFGLPAGPAIVLCAAACYILSVVFGREEGLIARYFPRRHLAA